MTASAWKVSAGAAARVPVARVTNLVRTLQGLKAAGVFVVGLDGGGDTSITDLPFATDPLVLVVGSEGKGLSRLVREQCDAIASIPISVGGRVAQRRGRRGHRAVRGRPPAPRLRTAGAARVPRSSAQRPGGPVPPAGSARRGSRRHGAQDRGQ